MGWKLLIKLNPHQWTKLKKLEKLVKSDKKTNKDNKRQ